MGGVEASGRNVEEAVENALAELGASRDEVSVEVITQGGGGVLGLGGKEARVRVRMLEEGESPDEQAPPATVDDGEHAEGEYVEDEAEIAAQTLDAMLAMMGIEADVSIRDAETPGDGLGMVKAVLDIEGDDLGILIGRRGETLASLQYLLNLMMMRRFGERISFTVDVEGYRRRRERQLNTMARRLADQVKRSGRPAVMDPMPPNERRIIHLALAEDRYVSTSSTGEGDERRVTISPKGRRL